MSASRPLHPRPARLGRGAPVLSCRGLAAAAVLALSACAPLLAQAQDALRIGYVNSERVLREAAPAKAALARMEADFSKRDKELNDVAARLKSVADKLDKDAPTLSESERTRRQRDLQEQGRELERKRREFQEDLNQRRNEETQAIVERANKVIKSIFENEKYDLILQDAVFFSPRVDITDKVIKALGAAPAAK
ncbi:OmpH family outer membrane protein [Pseudaquabacterium rugosum]